MILEDQEQREKISEDQEQREKISNTIIYFVLLFFIFIKEDDRVKNNPTKGSFTVIQVLENRFCKFRAKIVWFKL